MKQLLLLFLLSMTNHTYAAVHIYTDHKLILPVEGYVDSPIYSYESSFNRINPYIADIGISYISGNSSYYGGYEYKQNYDLKEGNVFNYSGIFFRYNYSHCISKCK